MHINLELCRVAQQGAAVLKHLASITRSEMAFDVQQLARLCLVCTELENLDDNITHKDIISYLDIA